MSKKFLQILTLSTIFCSAGSIASGQEHNQPNQDCARLNNIYDMCNVLQRECERYMGCFFGYKGEGEKRRCVCESRDSASSTEMQQ
jgi:hypothetical protein